MPFEEVMAAGGADLMSPAPGDGPPVTMLDDAPSGAEDRDRPWRGFAVPRVVGGALLAALVVGAVVGALATYAVDHGAAGGAAPADIQVRLDSEALEQGLDVYGLTRPALPLLIENRERTEVRVAELTWASPEGRLAWYGDASAVGPGQHGRIWGESEISCGGDGSRHPGLYAYVLVPGGAPRTVRLDDPGSLAVFAKTVQRACG